MILREVKFILMCVMFKFLIVAGDGYNGGGLEGDEVGDIDHYVVEGLFLL